MKFSFTHHTISALKVNSKRKKYYASLTNGSSKFITFILNCFSIIMLPITFFVDIYANKFIKKGVKILQNDFVELTEINLKTKAVERTNAFSNDVYKQVDNIRKNYISAIRKSLRKKELFDVCILSAEFLQNISLVEIENNCNIPMTKHIVESIGFNALHGIKYSKQSYGKTLKLSIFLIRLHVCGLLNSLKLIDKPSQKFFSKGVGIVINDIPKIPFLDELNKTQKDVKTLQSHLLFDGR